MKKTWTIPVALIALLAGGAAQVVQDQCGPFTDVTPAFCPFTLELYYLGITAGTSATTFSPDDPLTRGQGAVFIAKGLNQSLARSSRRAALGQWWTTTPRYADGLGFTPLDIYVGKPCADGADIWVPSEGIGVTRIRASDGKILGTWPSGSSVLCAMGKVFFTQSSKLYMIDPAGPPGAATLVTDQLGKGARALAFDGNRIWTANPVGSCACDPYPPGSVSIVTPGTWSVQTVLLGDRYPNSILFDGTSMWATEASHPNLIRFDSSGAVTQTVSTGGFYGLPAFDGTNIWVPSDNATVAVVRASTGEVLTVLAGNGLGPGVSAAFDGSRMLILSGAKTGVQISLWNAQDLTPLESVTAEAFAGVAAISDGINFWLTLSDFSSRGGLGRF